MKASHIAKKNECEVQLSSTRSINVPRYKLRLVAWYATRSVRTASVLGGCKCSSFVSFRADDTDTPVCCASPARDFPGDVSNLRRALSRLSSFSMCCLQVSYCLNSNILLENLSLTCKRFSCMKRIQQENWVIWRLKRTLRESSVQNLFHVTLLAPSIWTWLLDFCKTISYTFLISHTVLRVPPINFTVQKVYHQSWNYFESLLPHTIVEALVRQQPQILMGRSHVWERGAL